MNASYSPLSRSDLVRVIGPLFCPRMQRVSNEDGSVTLVLTLDRMSQQRMHREQDIHHVILCNVVYRVFRTGMIGDISLRTPPPPDPDVPPYVPVPVRGVIASPNLSDVPSATGPSVLYLMGVSPFKVHSHP